MKTPPSPESADGVFHAFTSGKVAALELKTSLPRFRSGGVEFFSSRFPSPLGPGLAFGLAAGAIAAGVAGAYGPYCYGPGYGYYGPRYYGYYGPPAYYGPGPYAYYGGPHYRHRCAP